MKQLITKKVNVASTSFSADHAILNDTSLAAVSTSDGNRHVFFQDASWNIRECVFTLSTGKWSALTSSVIATDAKHYTPMSTFQYPPSEFNQGSEQVSFLVLM